MRQGKVFGKFIVVMSTFRPFLFCICVVLLQSCVNHDATPSQSANTTVNWQKIELPKGGALYSFYGNIDQTLIVSTLGKILRTEDGGKTWQTVLDNVDSFSEFRKNGNEILAVANFTDYSSSDDGKTWQALSVDLVPSLNHSATNSKGTVYKLEFHSDGELGTPTSVLESCGAAWKNIFPFQHDIYSIFVDNDDRLYIGTNDWAWNGLSFVESPSGTAAVIYYSSK